MNADKAVWYKSTYSQNQGQCVEIAQLPALVGVRDSVHPEKGALAFPRQEWAAFLDELKGQ
ncbi:MULTISPECIES: DUF397 domain-containing protein [unclassified Nocardiopsis]|uniref:DUF397 domain-containing protein n=1 Tax=unclassified Nocardiopsis TaxID=2649073 RepID=UPI00135843B9|nr:MULTISPECIES: DUF397 domain-containing protein [unclassified Nocardiopsis]